LIRWRLMIVDRGLPISNQKPSINNESPIANQRSSMF